MSWGFYVRKGEVFVPTMAKTEAGFYLEVEPVEVAPVEDVDAVATAIEKVIARGNPIVPTPDRDNYPRAVVLAHANVRSWSAFANRAVSWGIENKHGRFSIVPSLPYANSSFVDDHDHAEMLPENATSDMVARRAAEKALANSQE